MRAILECPYSLKFTYTLWFVDEVGEIRGALLPSR